MKIFMTGGTGFVGSYLRDALAASGHQVEVLSRSSARRELPPGVSLVDGNPTRPGLWQSRAAQCDVAINLAGASIFSRWSSSVKKQILESRILTTRNLVEALRDARPGFTLLSASAVGYYGGYPDCRELDESTPRGKDFLADVAARWEDEAGKAQAHGIRVAICRFGIVLGRGGGAMAAMLPAFRSMIAGPLGSGQQCFPWVHIRDILGAVQLLIENEGLSGPFNITSPEPVTNVEFTRAMARSLHRPAVMPALPKFVLKAALGEFGSILLEGQNARPRRLLEAGYEFRFPGVDAALQDLVS